MIPSASKKIQDKIKQQSETLLAMAEKKFDLQLDYSEESLEITDYLITIFFKEHREHYIKATVLLGSYLGEIIINNLGGKWAKDLSIKKVGDLKGFAHPMTRARKRLANGRNDSLIHYYKNLKITTCRSAEFAADREKFESYLNILRENGWDILMLTRMLDEAEALHVREEAAEVLGKIAGDNVRDSLVRAAADPKTVYYAAIALQGFPVEEAYDLLLENLKETDKPRVKQQILLALGELGNPDSIDDIIDFISDDDEIVGHFAALALGKIGDPAVVDKLLAIMAGLRPGSRENAITALEILGDPRAVPALIEALFSREEQVREAAARALQYIPDQRAFKALAYCLKDESSRIRILAAYALANIENDETIPLIKELLTDGVKNVRLHATHLLNWLKKGKKPQAKVI